MFHFDASKNGEPDFKCYRCKTEFLYSEIVNDSRAESDHYICPSCGWSSIVVLQRPSNHVLNTIREIGGTKS